MVWMSSTLAALHDLKQETYCVAKRPVLHWKDPEPKTDFSALGKLGHGPAKVKFGLDDKEPI